MLLLSHCELTICCSHTDSGVGVLDFTFFKNSYTLASFVVSLRLFVCVCVCVVSSFMFFLYSVCFSSVSVCLFAFEYVCVCVWRVNVFARVSVCKCVSACRFSELCIYVYALRRSLERVEWMSCSSCSSLDLMSSYFCIRLASFR